MWSWWLGKKWQDFNFTHINLQNTQKFASNVISYVESWTGGKPSRDNSRKCFSWGNFPWPAWHRAAGMTFPCFIPAWPARDGVMGWYLIWWTLLRNDKLNGEHRKKDVVIIVLALAPHKLGSAVPGFVRHKNLPLAQARTQNVYLSVIVLPQQRRRQQNLIIIQFYLGFCSLCRV